MAEEKEQKQKKGRPDDSDELETLIRIFDHDIPGSRKIIPALSRIKGISWAIANAACIRSGIDKSKRLSELSKDEITKLEVFLKDPAIPNFMKNRQSDPETGETNHFYSTDLDFKKEFDIKRLRKIRSYRGIRHGLKLPVRGQRTKSHFRAKGRKAVGVAKKK